MSGRPIVSAQTRQLAEFGILTTVLIWSANFVIVKAAIGEIGPFSFTAARYLVASLTLLAILWWRQGSIRPPAGYGWALLALGVLGFGCYQVLWTTGLTMISAGDSALILAVSPVLTALLAAAVGMDRLTAPKLAGALLAFAGVVVVIGASHALSLGSSLLGDALTLGAAVVWAVYSVGASKVVRSIDPLRATTWTVIAGAAFLVPLGVAESVASPPVEVTIAIIGAVLYSGVLAAGVANVFVFIAIRYVGPTRTTAMQLLLPAGAVVLGAIFLAEPIGLPQVVGGAVIVAGVWLTRRSSILPASMRARLSSAS
ncbi:MAG TPA: DMT family transporter [Candidatus Limnocylindrales bacterium]